MVHPLCKECIFSPVTRGHQKGSTFLIQADVWASPAKMPGVTKKLCSVFSNHDQPANLPACPVHTGLVGINWKKNIPNVSINSLETTELYLHALISLYWMLTSHPATSVPHYTICEASVNHCWAIHHKLNISYCPYCVRYWVYRRYVTPHLKVHEIHHKQSCLIRCCLFENTAE